MVALQDVALLDYLASGADDTARRMVPAGAQRLTVHPNTVHYRLGRVATLTGRDPRRFDDLAELLTALRLLGS